jgi:hypothetical protein
MNPWKQKFLLRAKQSFLLVAIAAVAYVPTGAAPAGTNDAPRVTRPMLIDMEKSLDSRVTRLSQDNPFVLLGPTRGVYLDGYGAVFTAEINLVSAPAALMMFRPQLTKEEVEQHRQKKLARLPQLKQAMQQAMMDSAASLDTVPPQEQIVVVAFLSKYPWEDMTGVPLQIMMQATKKNLLEQRNNAAALSSVIRTIEN